MSDDSTDVLLALLREPGSWKKVRDDAADLIEAYQARRCDTCAHGRINPRYPIDEIGVHCEVLGHHFRPEFFCATWVQRRHPIEGE